MMRKQHVSAAFVLRAELFTDMLTPDLCDIEDEDEAVSCLLGAGYQALDAAPIQQVYVAQLESLKDRYTSSNDKNVMVYDRGARSSSPINTNHPRNGESRRHDKGRSNMQYSFLIDDSEVGLYDSVRNTHQATVSRAFRRAGPRENLHFEAKTVNAAIVTCGGLCPGLNNVIRELVHSLFYLYDVNKVYGIIGGYNGFHSTEYPPIELTCEMVDEIHHNGGTVLHSSRGGFDIDKILNFLIEKDIQQLYVIGGDGTHRGAYTIHKGCMENDMNVAVAGIPKTIDDDIDFIDRTFGFDSAVEASQAAIRSAKTEASCFPNGVGIVKLMGRSAGFLAAYAALASGDVDLVLIPEVPIVLEGEDGILAFLKNRLLESKNVVVVVAEGAGEELLETSAETDLSGNKKLAPIGEYIRDIISKYLKSEGIQPTIKFIDPSYMVRSVPANAADALYCSQLAQDAVHGAMAGYTGFSVGLVNNEPVYIPIPQLVATSPRSMDPNGTVWSRIRAMTGQPNHVEEST